MFIVLDPNLEKILYTVMKLSYAKSISFVNRCARADALLKQYPDRRPMILEKSPTDKVLPDIEVTKYIIPEHMTVSNVIQDLRKRLNIKETQAIYVCVGNTILSGSQSIGYVYDTYRDADKMLYISYCGEEVFG